MLTPTVNAQQAGTIAASADMNNYAAACSFLLAPPMVWTQNTGAQSIGASGAAINWAAPTRDNDSTWSSGSPSQFAVQTQGWYEVNSHIPMTTAGNTANGYIKVTTGANNPAGSGIVSTCWLASCGQDGSMSLAICGLIPQLLYIADIIQIFVDPQNACATATTGQGGCWPDYSHRLVSL